MSQFSHTGLTFDDVSLLTSYADFLPEEADIQSRFSRNVPLNIPFVSAAMDTVTESEMAIAVALLGGIGVIHKNLDVEAQAAHISKVKHYLNGLITDPVTFRESQPVAEVLAEKKENKYQFTGFPILNKEGKLSGILTARDIKFCTNHELPVSEVMTRDLIVGSKGISTAEAFEIMLTNRVGKLPILDDEGSLAGLYSFHDVRTIQENIEPGYNRDDEHRLRVAGALGPYDEERMEALVKAGTDVLVIDTAHGHSKGVIETLKYAKKEYPQMDVVAGNVATGEGAKELVDAGADGIKVGIGPGSICTTRVVAGVGIPQVSAVYNVRKAIGEEVPVISDGGIAHSGDVAKAIAVGADCVMMGSTLAGTEESPGERILHQGRTYVVYRGMGSLEAMKEAKGSRERYGQRDVDTAEELVPQGVEGVVPYRGRVADVLLQFAGGIRYSLGYCGAETLKELQKKAKLIRVSPAALYEAHPHDIKVLKDAPNYTTRR
ncbi:MAG: IMP dehydrogenase [Lentisphaeria bacterium]